MSLEPFRLERYFARYEFSVEHLLCCSDCESVPLKELLDLEPGAREAFEEVWLGYTESEGAPPLRRRIATLYERVPAQGILVHSGAEEGIFTFMNGLLSPGDEVIVHWPCYQSLTEVARNAGAQVRPWRVSPEESWRLDLGWLRDAITSKTRAVVVNLPHNPTGATLRRGEFQELIAICRRRGLTLFSDEVYRFSEYRREDRLPAAADAYERAVSLGVLSKAFGLAGLRIGWAACPDRRVLERMAAVKDYTTICSAAPSEFLAELALRHRGSLLARNRRILESNLKLLDDFFAEHSSRLSWVRPQAGPVCYPALESEEPVDDFCRRVREKSGVLLLPGSVYEPSTRHFRLGFGRRETQAALKRFSGYLNGR